MDSPPKPEKKPKVVLSSEDEGTPPPDKVSNRKLARKSSAKKITDETEGGKPKRKSSVTSIKEIKIEEKISFRRKKSAVSLKSRGKAFEIEKRGLGRNASTISKKITDETEGEKPKRKSSVTSIKEIKIEEKISFRRKKSAISLKSRGKVFEIEKRGLGRNASTISKKITDETEVSNRKLARKSSAKKIPDETEEEKPKRKSSVKSVTSMNESKPEEKISFLRKKSVKSLTSVRVEVGETDKRGLSRNASTISKKASFAVPQTDKKRQSRKASKNLVVPHKPIRSSSDDASGTGSPKRKTRRKTDLLKSFSVKFENENVWAEEETESANNAIKPPFDARARSSSISIKYKRRKFSIAPGFRTQRGCSDFVRKVLAVTSLKMVFPMIWSVMLSYFIQNDIHWCSLIVVMMENYWIIFIAMMIYGAAYFHLRILPSDSKNKEILTLVYLALFIACEICIFGILTVLLPNFLVAMILVMLTVTCGILAFELWMQENIEVRIKFLFVYTIPLLLLFGLAITVSLCLFLDDPERPVEVGSLFLNFLISFLCCYLMLTAMYSQVIKLMEGRMMVLRESDWLFAALVIPLAILYPAHLLKKGQTVIIPIKVHPVVSIPESSEPEVRIISADDTEDLQEESKEKAVRKKRSLSQMHRT